MAIRVAINHRTEYRFDRPISVSPHILRLRPAAHTRTSIEAYSLKVLPKSHFINWQQDPYGNYLARIVYPEPVHAMSFEVDVVAEMVVINPFDFFVENYAEKYPFQYDAQSRRELAPYLEIRERGPLLQAWLSRVDRSEQPVIDFLVALNHRLEKDIDYTIRLEPGIQSCEDTLERASGSCRDSGWLLVQILRQLGLAARFVSGYLVQLTPDEKPLEGPAGTDHDFTDLHAWAEVYVPGAGWLGLDPTSGLFAGEGHIPLACTPDPVSAAPVTGATDECEVDFTFSNSVQRIHEDPRVTKPYTETQWAAIEALGHRVDADLEAGDVRLTMGGEPTFVSIDDMESDQWNSAALGDRKRRLAGDLLVRLWRRFAPGGMLHYGQGKWYPGEPLPRWALNCFWRTDGEPVWRDPRLFAADGADEGCGPPDAERFIRHVARALGLSERYVVPGYEDSLYYLWKEGMQPDNVDLLCADLRHPEERSRLTRLLAGDLGAPAGFALPIRWDEARERWRSSIWTFRRQRMFLTPGDSPMGLRLPLDALPWVAEEAREIEPERCLFAPRPPLGDYYGEVTRRFSRLEEATEIHPEIMQQEFGDDDAGRAARRVEVIHTALCVEPRDGVLHVFLPPLTYLEHYLDLVSSIELAAAALAVKVRLEGYEPPRDWRIRKLAVTPDPGVIEVNIHPALDWGEMVNQTQALYAEAREARLGTEKFMLDGRHTGTSGGNHVTIGGATPADSPMLRRPDLLRSLLTYWQHHPGLSYLFSGLFIGPTSQAPRADEARDENLYELEIAFQQIPEGEVPEPWLVDRVLRNLLVDVTGNTHRAEFCIDKLYSPDSAAGRLGLVEFRAFEMPPHARMSLVQMLLLRTLIAWFWRRPYRHALVRWGTELHDRFMLPHYVRADVDEVVCDLQRAGYPFQAEWLAPFHEFRFPHFGSVAVRDIHMEVRAALEPWHVLGEEVTRLGTARFVDSSLERLQVRLTGLTDTRYLVACNGRRVPLHNTGTHGEYVAGVRYRAWQPPSALHPTIGVHSPLVFDIIDTWNGRSIGGCTYHVAHPGGRHYEDFPVNAYVAETRRVSRFWGYGHTPGRIEPPPEIAELARFFREGHPAGPMSPPPEERNPEYPYTLDLRYRYGCN
jgi:uncharacterized protein (DUF2126 family)/transglutaminase-like putative cysteine protease